MVHQSLQCYGQICSFSAIKRDPNVLSDQLTSALLRDRDTMSSLLNGLFLVLGRKLDAWGKLKAEA
jgi:hypothetical protein